MINLLKKQFNYKNNHLNSFIDILNEKNYNMKVIYLTMLLFLAVLPSILSLSCQFQKGSVAYYTGINLPTTSRIDGSFILFTDKSDTFTLFNEDLDAKNSILHLTLDQVNEKNVEFIVWNDDIPDDDSSLYFLF